MSRARIVIINEERDTAEAAAERLRKEGYEVEFVDDGEDGLPQLRAVLPDLVLLGMTPDRAGRIVKRLRKSTKTARTPILMIADRDPAGDRVVGLEVGVDDFIVRPVNPAELSARVDVLLRRVEHQREGEEQTYQIGPIRINMNRHEVAVDEKPLKLTLTEFRLLTALAEANGRILQRNLLIDQAIGMDAIVTDRTIDVHLASLRRKLGPARDCLKTVRGVGYRLADDKNDDV